MKGGDDIAGNGRREPNRERLGNGRRNKKSGLERLKNYKNKAMLGFLLVNL